MANGRGLGVCGVSLVVGSLFLFFFYALFAVSFITGGGAHNDNYHNYNGFKDYTLNGTKGNEFFFNSLYLNSVSIHLPEITLIFSSKN
jgi:hypothetical protein